MGIWRSWHERVLLFTVKSLASADCYYQRVVAFATKYPELAKHVHRLQLLVPPIIRNWDARKSPEVTSSSQLILSWTSAQVSIIRGIVGPPLHMIKELEIAALSPCWFSSGESLGLADTAIFDTLRSLPNLRHIEHAVSTQQSRVFRPLQSKILNETGLSIFRDRLADTSTQLALQEGTRLILGNVGPSITSLKLRSVAKPYPRIQNIPVTLQHLDLEIYDKYIWRGGADPDDALLMTGWRSNLAPLRRLRTLRLSWGANYNILLDRFYVDDLFIDPKDSTKNILFPHLERLSLSDCYLRLQGLLTFATSHSSTLKDLELKRMTFDPAYSPGSWSEIGTLCKSIFPNLAHLRLARLTTHFPIQALDQIPVRRRWNRGLEAATAYEWTKDVQGRGVEVIGPKCPWEPEDVVDDENCKLIISDDKYKVA